MIKEFVNLYNNLVNLSRNKSLFSIFTDKDTFSDRLLILLFHFAFFLRKFKENTNKEYLQKFYDYFFRQIELSLREIGYGDVSINKKMKDYINVFHAIISEIHFWDSLNLSEKKDLISKFLENFDNIDDLTDYFDKCEKLHIDVPNTFIYEINKYNDQYINKQMSTIDTILSYKGEENKPTQSQIAMAKKWCELYRVPINEKCIYLN